MTGQWSDERAQIRAWLDEYELSFRHAGDAAVEFEITESGAVIVCTEDGDTELEFDAVEDWLAEYSAELGERSPPRNVLAIFLTALQEALDDHAANDHDGDADDEECCYEVVSEALEGLDPAEAGLTQVDGLLFEDEDGTVFELNIVDGVSLDPVDEHDNDDDDPVGGWDDDDPFGGWDEDDDDPPGDWDDDEE